MVLTRMQYHIQGFSLSRAILHSETKERETLVSKMYGRVQFNPVYSRSRLHLHPHQLLLLQETKRGSTVARANESK